MISEDSLCLPVGILAFSVGNAALWTHLSWPLCHLEEQVTQEPVCPDLQLLGPAFRFVSSPQRQGSCGSESPFHALLEPHPLVPRFPCWLRGSSFKYAFFLCEKLLACLPSHPSYSVALLHGAVLMKYHNLLIGELFVNLINSLTVLESWGSLSGRGLRTLACVC